MLNVILDRAMDALKDKEIAQKVPLFSLVSTMEVVNKAITMKEIQSDPKIDDVYICSADGDEVLPPECDNIGKIRKLNAPEVVASITAKHYEDMISNLGSKTSPLGKHHPTQGRGSTMSVHSVASRTSKISQHHAGDETKGK